MPSSGVDLLAERDRGGFLGEAALSLYGVAGRVGVPVADAFLRLRARDGKEDLSRRGERWGIPGKPRPSGPLVWVHCASVGETNAALPLIEKVAARGPTLLLTTGTVTAAEIAKPRLPRNAIHQFVPIDTPTAVRRFLDHWRPDLALFAESELWPTTLRVLRERALPLAVFNARMSERSFRSWQRFASLAQAVLGRADLFLAQTSADAERLRTLGAERVVVCGNMKFDVPPPTADPAAVATLRANIGDRAVFVAASTHPGEEAAVIAAHRELVAGGARLVTIIAPRHRERGNEITKLVEAECLSLGTRSRGDEIGAAKDIYLADTIGEMGLWYRLADIAFLGGSMVPHGGQNPIEPAKLGVPIIYGTYVSNFRDVYDALARANAAATVGDAAGLAVTVKRLIETPEERARLSRAALDCLKDFSGALDRTIDALEPYLSRLGVRT